MSKKIIYMKIPIEVNDPLSDEDRRHLKETLFPLVEAIGLKPILELVDNMEEPCIGLLNIETDWDYGLVVNGVSYCGSEETIKVKTIEELRNVKYLGPFGAPACEDSKLWEIKEALTAILKDPARPFSNLGGNRGAEWIPLGRKAANDVNAALNAEVNQKL